MLSIQDAKKTIQFRTVCASNPARIFKELFILSKKLFAKSSQILVMLEHTIKSTSDFKARKRTRSCVGCYPGLGAESFPFRNGLFAIVLFREFMWPRRAHFASVRPLGGEGRLWADFCATCYPGCRFLPAGDRLCEFIQLTRNQTQMISAQLPQMSHKRLLKMNNIRPGEAVRR